MNDGTDLADPPFLMPASQAVEIDALSATLGDRGGEAPAPSANAVCGHG